MKVFNYSIGFNRQDAYTELANDSHTLTVRMAVAEERTSNDHVAQLQAILKE
jgi:hypothetical protein